MFIPEEFVAIAEALRSGSADAAAERRFRTSISRAYYAVYLTLRQHIRAARADPTYDVEHGKLARWLAEHPNLTVGRFGTEFRDLFKRRTSSDYELHDVLSEAAEQVSILSARSLISRASTVVALVSPATFPVRVRTH